MMGQKFQKKVEDFECEVCGTKVKGSGYTDHCPTCLWSKHLDIYPGDRKSPCGGLMEPVGLEITGSEKKILYRCKKCGYNHKVKVSENDSPEALLQLSTR